MTMQAYKNDSVLREQFIAELKWHQDGDKIIQGDYCKGTNRNFRGCAVGCAIHSLAKIRQEDLSCSNHQLLEDLIDIPVELAHLIDGIFETLPIEKAKLFPLEVGQAIRCGADLKMVVPQFIYWMLQDAPKPTNAPSAFTEYVDAVTAIYEQWIKDGAKPPLNSDLAYRADLVYRAYLWRTGRTLAERSAAKLIELLKLA